MLTDKEVADFFRHLPMGVRVERLSNGNFEIKQRTFEPSPSLSCTQLMFAAGRPEDQENWHQWEYAQYMHTNVEDVDTAIQHWNKRLALDDA